MRPEVLWCPNYRHGRINGWAFPPAVKRHLQQLTFGQRVCHLFGGLATFGTRLDIDALVRPDVIGDAWLPPFQRDAFDIVILDPPYFHFNQQMKQQLFRQAGWIARRSVIWFHTIWVAADAGMRLEKAWLVRVGDMCAARTLQVFSVSPEKQQPRQIFTRGPALRYNRWLNGTIPLPLRESV
jgi:hypothetical protein